MAEMPVYILMDEATRRYGIDQKVLVRLVESGKIRAARLDGQVLVMDEDIQKITLRDKLWSQVAHLDQRPITLYQARAQYRIGSVTLYNWINQGIVRVLKRAQKGKKPLVLINEADVAYAALVARERGVSRGRRTFTPDFLPPHLQSLHM